MERGSGQRALRGLTGVREAENHNNITGYENYNHVGWVRGAAPRIARVALENCSRAIPHTGSILLRKAPSRLSRQRLLARGFDLRIVRFDALPALGHSSLDEALNPHGVNVERAARGAHWSLSCCEASQDPLTRMAEASLQRAEKSLTYLVRARLHAGHIRNLKVAAGRSVTRHEIQSSLGLKVLC